MWAEFGCAEWGIAVWGGEFCNVRRMALGKNFDVRTGTLALGSCI